MSDEELNKLREDLMKKNHESIRAMLAYTSGLASTGHVKPTPPWPKDEIACLVAGLQLLHVVIGAASGWAIPGYRPLPHP